MFSTFRDLWSLSAKKPGVFLIHFTKNNTQETNKTPAASCDKHILHPTKDSALCTILGNEMWFQTYDCTHAHTRTHSSDIYLLGDGMFCNTEPIRHTNTPTKTWHNLFELLIS